MKKIIEKSRGDVSEIDCTEVCETEALKNNQLFYEKPVLKCYGDVRDITLGPSPGVGESGAGVFTFRN